MVRGEEDRMIYTIFYSVWRAMNKNIVMMLKVSSLGKDVFETEAGREIDCYVIKAL